MSALSGLVSRFAFQRDAGGLFPSLSLVGCRVHPPPWVCVPACLRLCLPSCHLWDAVFAFWVSCLRSCPQACLTWSGMLRLVFASLGWSPRLSAVFSSMLPPSFLQLVPILSKNWSGTLCPLVKVVSQVGSGRVCSPILSSTWSEMLCVSPCGHVSVLSLGCILTAYESEVFLFSTAGTRQSCIVPTNRAWRARRFGSISVSAVFDAVVACFARGHRT